MGYAFGVKLNYNPFWEEHKDDMTTMEQMYHIGYEDGYGEGSEYRERLEVLEQENVALRELCAANVRVIKQELAKEKDQK